MGANAPTGAPADTSTREATEAIAPEVPAATTPGTTEMTLSELDAARPPASAPFVGGEPIPASELQGSRTYPHMLYLVGRLDGYLAANGVPADWETEGFGYIAVVYDNSSWDPDVMSGFLGQPDGSYTLRGWSSKNPKFNDFNTGLEYDSVRGFITG
ncbi:hypothetical protein ACQCSX_15940 [Pseudarthrobacter sp. P1]|uniref:hypothetical protein n=1 Tax=Pseudarthrobacter sp. P1 TaxID=3418418 RepID=UPI003CEE714D